MTAWKVGDPVVIEVKQYTNRRDDGPRQTVTGTVTKVARKYFTVQVEGQRDPQQFEIATGRERPKNPDFTNYLDRAYSPAGYEAELSRSYPEKERGKWRMYCDTCDHVDPDRFDRQPPLQHYAAKGWFIGKLTDRCPRCRLRSDLKPVEAHSVMSPVGEVGGGC